MSLFVGNLPNGVKEDDLKLKFKNVGNCSLNFFVISIPGPLCIRRVR